MDITILVEENEKLKTEITRTSHHYKYCIVSILDYRNCAEFFTNLKFSLSFSLPISVDIENYSTF